MTTLLNVWHDVRIAGRSLARQPVQSLMIAGILAVGIAGTTTVFSLFNGVVLLSEGLWKRMFDSDPTIIGHSVCLDDDPSYTVVGVLPDATFPDHKDLWCPLR